LLASLVEQRAGGQKRLAFGSASANGEARAFVAASLSASSERNEDYPNEAGPSRENGSSENPTVNEPGPTLTMPSDALQLPGKAGGRRPAHYGLDIQFEDRSEDVKLGRLVESTVWVNRAHPAYCRALASRSIGYHIALAVAMALAPLAVEPQKESEFLLTFLTRWGEAIDKSALSKRASGR
jgi:hypothetical protein